MEENKNEQLLPPQEIPGDDIPLPDDELWDMPELTLEEHLDDTPIQPEPMDIMEPPASEQPNKDDVHQWEMCHWQFH